MNQLMSTIPTLVVVVVAIGLSGSGGGGGGTNAIKFCDRHNRELLLGGIFGHKSQLWAYSWMNYDMDQQQIVWRFESSTDGNNRFRELGTGGVEIDRVFSGIPLFRTGFCLDLVCSDTDSKCLAANGLAFVFFQTSYRVYRVDADTNRFSPLSPTDWIPWSLQPIADSSAFWFGIKDIDIISAIVFVANKDNGVGVGQQQQQQQSYLFMTSKGILYKSVVRVSEPGLKWSVVSQISRLESALGGFLLDNRLLYFNIIDDYSPDGILLAYSFDGIQQQMTSVIKFFGCKQIRSYKAMMASLGDNSMNNQQLNVVPETDMIESNNRLAMIFISIIVVIAVVTNILVIGFWIRVLRQQQQQQTDQQK